MKTLMKLALFFVSPCLFAHDFQKIDEIDRMSDKRQLSLVAESEGVAFAFKTQREMGFMQKMCGLSTEDANRVTWFDDDLEVRYRIDQKKPKSLTLIPNSLTWAQAYNCSLWKAVTKSPDAETLLLEIRSIGGDKTLLEFNVEGLANDLKSMYADCKQDKNC